MSTLSDRYNEARDAAFKREVPQPGYYDQCRYDDFFLGADFPKETWIAMYEALGAWKNCVETKGDNISISNFVMFDKLMRKALAKAEEFLNGQQKEKD